jgi:hypothetical protein
LAHRIAKSVGWQLAKRRKLGGIGIGWPANKLAASRQQWRKRWPGSARQAAALALAKEKLSAWLAIMRNQLAINGESEEISQ